MDRLWWRKEAEENGCNGVAMKGGGDGWMRNCPSCTFISFDDCPLRGQHWSKHGYCQHRSGQPISHYSHPLFGPLVGKLLFQVPCVSCFDVNTIFCSTSGLLGEVLAPHNLPGLQSRRLQRELKLQRIVRRNMGMTTVKAARLQLPALKIVQTFIWVVCTVIWILHLQGD
jgi:hypothetical protein